MRMKDRVKNKENKEEKDQPKIKKPWYKRAIVWMILVCVMLAGVVAFFLIRGRMNSEIIDEDIYIDDGSYDEIGQNNYYMGVVEAEQTWEIEKDSDRTVTEVFVAEGDAVTVGQALFSYDTDATKVSLEQAQLEVDNYTNSILDYQNQIANLTKLQNATTVQGEKDEYQTQINSVNMQIRQAELGVKTKQIEIEDLQKKLENATVTSTMDGVVKSIATASSTEKAYMTILTTAEYRVKGTVDEANVGMLSLGQTVIVHSRVNDQTWTGKITKIDTSGTANSNNSEAYYSTSSSGEASKYYFYVTLDQSEGLLLGQHVYLEPTYDFDVDMEVYEEEVVEEDTEDEESTEDLE